MREPDDFTESDLRDEIATLRAEQTRLREALKSIWQMTPCECCIDKCGERTYQCEACEVYESALSSTPTPETTP